jgi:hypothetical protein
MFNLDLPSNKTPAVSASIILFAKIKTELEVEKHAYCNPRLSFLINK